MFSMMYHEQLKLFMAINLAFLCDNYAALEGISPKHIDLSEADMIKFKVWPHGQIPYFIDDFSFDKVLRDRIRMYLETAGQQTGLRFIELLRPPEQQDYRWVFFVNRRGYLECYDYYAYNFTIEGAQRVILGYDCLKDKSESLATAVLAIAGVPPQHNAPDRDDFIEIQKKNILPEKLYLFNILNEKDWLFGDLNYDFASATHYDFYEYSSTGRMTIKPKVPYPFREFQNTNEDGLSPTDIIKVKMLYNSTMHNKLSASNCQKLFRSPSKMKSKMNDNVNKTKLKKETNDSVLFENEVKNSTDNTNDEVYVTENGIHEPTYVTNNVYNLNEEEEIPKHAIGTENKSKEEKRQQRRNS